MVKVRKLTKVQKQIMELLLTEGLTVKQIAIRRGVSQQAIYKTIKLLTKKGFLNGTPQRGLKKPYPHALTKQKNLKKYIRLHGVELHITPYFFSRKYHNIRKKSNLLSVMGCTIRLYKNTIEVYSGETLDFKGETVQRATAIAQEYFNRLFMKLENDLHIGIVKDRLQNIKVVNSHYAEVNNEIAKELDKTKTKITIYGKDGYAWFKIDTSWNFNEAETIHPEQSKLDAQLIFEKYLNDLRENCPPTNSELATAIMQQIKLQSIYNENIKLHLSVLKEIKQAIKDLKNVVIEEKQKQVSELCKKLLLNIKTVNDVFLYKGFIKKLNQYEKRIIEEHLFRIQGGTKTWK